jgi:hypothetical protein
VEAEATKLREQFSRGRITKAQLESGLRDLMVLDEQGRWWTVGVQSGTWYYHNGEDWVRSTPPGRSVSRPTSQPASPSARAGTPAAPATPTNPIFDHAYYRVRGKMRFGFDVQDRSGNVIFRGKYNAIKLLEDFHLFTGEEPSTELLAIHQRTLLNVPKIYDVTDVVTGEGLGAIKFGMAGLQILDVNGDEIAKVQRKKVRVGRTDVGTLKSKRSNPLSNQAILDLGSDTRGLLDRRLGLALAILRLYN